MVEIRQITQVKVWKLIMNPITGRSEDRTIVAFSTDRDKLINWYQSQVVPTYTEEGHSHFNGNAHLWDKNFTKGGELEWFNPICGFEGCDHFGHGIDFEWVDEGNIDSISGPIQIF